MGKTIDVSAEKKNLIKDRLLGILFSQTVDILDRSIVDASDLDVGCCLVLGFKKGPIELMRGLGAAEVERILTEFARYKSGMPMPLKNTEAYAEYYRFLLVSEIDGVVVITLRRPEAMNTPHDGMTNEILDVIRNYEDKADTDGFVITGYDTQSFCAGADIDKFLSMLGDRQQSIDYARTCSRLLVYLDQCNKPVIAALNGIALGGGGWNWPCVVMLLLPCHKYECSYRKSP